MAGFRDIMAGSAYIEISLRRSKFLRQLERTETYFTTQMEKLGRSAMQFGTQMATAGVFGLATFILPVKQFADFERAMDEVRIVAQATHTEFEVLKAQAKDLGATTVFSSLQAAHAMTVFAKAGLSVKEMGQAMEPTLSAAAIAQMDMATAASVVSGVMRGMGIEFTETKRAVDVLTRASIGSNTNIEELGNAFSYAGPLGRIAGESIESMSAALMMLANSNIRSNRAGTNLRGMLLALQDPSQEAKQMLNKLQIAVQDTGGGFMGLEKVLMQFEDRIGKMGGRQQAQILSQIFDKRQISGFMAMMAEGSAEYRKFQKGLEDKDGLDSIQVAAEMLDNLSGDFTLFMSVLNNFGIAVGETLSLPLRHAIKGLIAFTTSVQTFVEDNEELVFGIAAAFAGLAVAGAALVALGIAVNLVVFAIGGLLMPVYAVLGAFSALTAVVMWAAGIVVSSFTGVIGVIFTVARSIWFVFTAFNSVFGGIYRGIRGIFAVFVRLQAAVTRIFRFFTNLASFIGGVFVRAVSIFRTAWMMVVRVFGVLMNIGRALATVFNFLSGVVVRAGSLIVRVFQAVARFVSPLTNVIKNFATYVLNAFVKVFTSIGGFISRVFMRAVSYVRSALGAINKFLSPMYKDFARWWNAIVSFFKGVVKQIILAWFRFSLFITSTFWRSYYAIIGRMNLMKSDLIRLWKSTAKLITPQIARITKFAQKSWGWIATKASEFLSHIVRNFRLAGKQISGVWTSLITALKGNFFPVIVKLINMVFGRFPIMMASVIAAIQTVVSLLLFGLFGPVGAAIKFIYRGITGMFSSLIGFFKSFVSFIGGIFSSIWGFIVAIPRFFISLGKSIISAFKSAFDWVMSGWNAVVDFFTSTISFIQAVFVQMWENLASGFSQVFEFVKSVLVAVSDFFVGTVAFFGKVATGFTKIFEQEWGNVWEIFRITIGGVYDALASGNMARAGSIAMKGLKVVLIKTLDLISNAFGTSTENIAGFFIDAFTAIGVAWQQFMNVWHKGTNSVAGWLGNAGEWLGIVPEGTADQLKAGQAKADAAFKSNQDRAMNDMIKSNADRKLAVKNSLKGLRDTETELRKEAWDASTEREQIRLDKIKIGDGKKKKGKNLPDFSLALGDGVVEKAEGGKKAVSGVSNTTVGAAVSGLGKVGMLGAIQEGHKTTAKKLDHLIGIQKAREKKEVQRRKREFKVMREQGSAMNFTADALNGAMGGLA